MFRLSQVILCMHDCNYCLELAILKSGLWLIRDSVAHLLSLKAKYAMQLVVVYLRLPLPLVLNLWVHLSPIWSSIVFVPVEDTITRTYIHTYSRPNTYLCIPYIAGGTSVTNCQRWIINLLVKPRLGKVLKNSSSINLHKLMRSQCW